MSNRTKRHKTKGCAFCQEMQDKTDRLAVDNGRLRILLKDRENTIDKLRSEIEHLRDRARVERILGD